MSSTVKIPVVLVAVLTCGIAVAGAVVLRQENTSTNYVTDTSISDSKVSTKWVGTEKMAQTHAALEAASSSVLPLSTSTTPSTSISTSSDAMAPPVGELAEKANLEPENATKSGVAEVDKVSIPVYTKGTVLSAMESYQDTDRDFSFAGTKYPGIGFFVETLRGIEQGDGMYWMLYVNEKSTDLGASRTVVAPGDVVEWRLEASPF